MTDSSPTTLYRLYNADGGLLYVGIAGNPGRRFEQHRQDKPWWGSVANIRLEHFPTRDAASEAELKAIRTERPAYNIVGRSQAAASPKATNWRTYNKRGSSTAAPRWFCHDAWGHERSTAELTLVWEVDYAAVSDDFIEGQDDPHEVFELWLQSVTKKYDTWVPIYWFIDGISFEVAPFSHHNLNQQDFLSFFTWPEDVDGNPVNWLALPTDHAKSWFFSAVTGWTPAAYQPSVSIDLLRMAARADLGRKTHRPALQGDEWAKGRSAA